MAKEIRNTVRLGIFVTAGVLLFTIAVYYVGNEQNLFGAKFHLSTVVNNANGLRVGNNVRYAGIVVGSVDDIVFVNDSTLRIEMLLEERVRDFIRKDAVASIGTDGLVGNVIVNISPGTGNQPRAKEGEIIASYSRLDPNAMLETLGSTNDNIAVLSEKLLEISKNLNEGQGTLPLLIRDADMAVDVAQTLKNLRQATESLTRTSKELQQAMGEISKGKGTLGYLIHDETLPHQLENLATRLDSLLIEETRPVIENLQKSSRDLAASSAQLKAATQALEDGDGLATTILKDTAAANNLRDILGNLEEGTARFSEDMEALKHNFLFKRYFKKLEKEKKKKD
ncbi:MAG: MCE family protein [Saprospiraceae bacterium]|nr:MCE family protein [Saprospiraceae bacterium]